MALRKQITTDHDYEANYWKITSFTEYIDSEKISIIITCWKNKSARIKKNRYIAQREFLAPSGLNSKDEMYNYIKKNHDTRGEKLFSDAQDDL